MAVCIPSPWPYLLPLALFTIACCAIAIPGLVAPIQIPFHRRSVPEEPSPPGKPSSPDEGISRESVKYSNVNIRERNRDARRSHKRVILETENDRTSRLSTTTNNDNIVSRHRRRHSRTRNGDLLVNVELSGSEIESERTSRPTTATNLVLSKPHVGGRTPDRTKGYVTTGVVAGESRSDDVRIGMVSSQLDRMSVDSDEYYAYDDDNYLADEDDMDDDEEDDEDDNVDFDVVNEPRSKKDANTMRTEEWPSLQRLAELATISNPELGFINLITPNPDLDITIEVVTTDDDDVEGDIDMDVDNRLPGGDVPTIVRPGPRPEPELPPPQSTQTGGSSSGNGGDWSPWSSCTASCGGGKRERTRICGLQCRTTETQECNKRACSDTSVASEVDVGGSISPSTPQVDDHQTFAINQGFDGQTFAINQGFNIDVVDELPDVIGSADFDSCDQWMECRSEKLMSYLSRLEDLPSCPCLYPATIVANNAIFDQDIRKLFRWVELDPATARLDIYRPTATSCIQSLLSQHSTSLASQQCCYDADNRLITRGQGAGTPQLISAEISPELNYKIDVLPWIICKGDWTKYHRIRQPNNGRECRDVPDLQTFIAQFEEATNF